MTWPTPDYSKAQVNRVGKKFARQNFLGPEDIFESYDILTNWRSCHGYPINTFQSTLRTKLKLIDKNAIVAQRLKRLPSIVAKLRRFPNMALSQMQDIGGLRAVVGTIAKVRQLEKDYDDTRFDHERIAVYDYIDTPKDSGYRSLHVVYKYKNKRAPMYDGLRIELQFRTKLQHAWATAVETIGTFLEQPLKASEGPEEWLAFFALVSSAFAHMEETSRVPGFKHLRARETYRAVKTAAAKLNVWDRLEAFSIAANAIATDKKQGHFRLVVLDMNSKTVQITSFGKSKLDEANKEYALVEEKLRNDDGLQAVLVSSDSIDSLKRAYPNYFLDTKEFMKKLELVVSKA